MKELNYWGDNKEYGPFTKQEDGWPNAGEVIRQYRRAHHVSAEDLAKCYGEAIHDTVTARWILKMEQQNKVPMDITRRRILAEILHIPPHLLGLASLESVFTPSPVEQQLAPVPVSLKHMPMVNLTTYENYIRDRWLLSYTGEEVLSEIVDTIKDLEHFEQESRGDFQKHVWSVLNAYYQLASDVTRHQGDFSTAWMYANQAVRVTRLFNAQDLLAAALYRRGYTSLEWAFFGDAILSGRINQDPHKEKVYEALRDFEAALPSARLQLKGAIWLEMSRAQGFLHQPSLSLRLLHQAESMIATRSTLADPLDQILLEGALNGLSEGMYLLGKAATLIVLGRTTTALELLDDLDALKNGKGIVRNQARRLAYADLLRAEASLGQRDTLTAAIRATSALQTFQDIHTVEKIAWINTLARKLMTKSGHQEVKNLESMLRIYYKRTAWKIEKSERGQS